MGIINSSKTDPNKILPMTYLWARIAHTVAYTFAIPWGRTLTFAIGWLATLCILAQILL